MFCRKCGIQLDDFAMFCSGCGEKQIVLTEAVPFVTQGVESIEPLANAETIPAVASKAEPEVAVETEPQKKGTDKRFIGKTCAYCKTIITESDEITVCSACETALHKGCWDENGGCATFGCTGKPEGMVACCACGAEISAEQMFCAKCGSVKPAPEVAAALMLAQTNTSVCDGCGCTVEPQQKYCNQCGRQLMVTNENNVAIQSSIEAYNSSISLKRKFGKSLKSNLIVIAAIALILAIVAGFLINSSRIKAAEEYMRNVEKFSELCWSAGSDLEDVGNDIQDYWGEYVFTYGTTVYMGHYIYSVDDAVGYALSDNASKVNSIQSDWSSIQDLYDDLKDVPKNNNELSDIFEDVKDVYESFEDMYNCVIEVSGNYSTYKTNFENCDSALADTLEELDKNLE